MHGAGVARLARSNSRRVRALRVWTAGLAAFVALGLAALAGRPSVEPSSLAMYQMAGTPPAPALVEPVEPAARRPGKSTAPALALRPAYQPADRSIPTTRWAGRKASLGIHKTARKF